MLLDVGIKKQILGLDSGVFYKECEVCKESKQSKLFRLRKESKNHSRRPFCLTCEKNKHHNKYIKNKPAILESMQKHRLANWKEKMVRQAKSSAKIKGLEFNIEIKHIEIPETCKYLGIKLTQELGKGVVWSNCSLDRIDSSKGYVVGNIEVISRKANSMKNMATEEELVIFAKNILTIYGK